MSENAWKRLYRIAEARREHLGLSRAAVKAKGGPSSEWIRQLESGEGAPTVRRMPGLRGLSVALGWPESTAWDLLTKDRSGWSAELLEDEESALVYGDNDTDMDARIRHFQTIVGAALSSMTPEAATAAMVDMARVLRLDGGA